MKLLSAASGDAYDDGIRLDAQMEPRCGPGGTVKPAVYAGEVYQTDRRWPVPGGPHHRNRKAYEIFIVDNVPSQANRCEEALRRSRARTGVPEMVLDLSRLPGRPPQLPPRLSSWQFPHRNADVFLRCSTLDGADFWRHPLGGAILDATHDRAGALISWWPQALLYGFWRSRRDGPCYPARHARAWVSEMVGWRPDTPPKGRQSPPPVSFCRVTQRATVSFAQLRRIGLGPDSSPEADAAARALLVAMGLHGHTLAFDQGFTLRSGADLRVCEGSMTWLGPSDERLDPLDRDGSAELLRRAKQHAVSVGVPLDGWDREPLVLDPKDCFTEAVEAAWRPEEAN